MAASQKVFLRALIWVMVYVCPRFRSLCRSHLVNKTHRFGLIRPDDQIYTTNVEANSEKRGGGGGRRTSTPQCDQQQEEKDSDGCDDVAPQESETVRLTV